MALLTKPMQEPMVKPTAASGPTQAVRYAVVTPPRALELKNVSVRMGSRAKGQAQYRGSHVARQHIEHEDSTATRGDPAAYRSQQRGNGRGVLLVLHRRSQRILRCRIDASTRRLTLASDMVGSRGVF